MTTIILMSAKTLLQYVHCTRTNNSGDKMDEALKTAYESVLILSLINPVVNNTAFQTDIRTRSIRDYGYKFKDTEPVCIFCLYKNHHQT